MSDSPSATERHATLDDYCAAGSIAPIDVASAQMLVSIARRSGDRPEPPLLAWVGMCLALRTPRDGHTCVDLSRIADWAGRNDPAWHGHPPWPHEPQPWVDALMSVPTLVGSPGERTPFILDQTIPGTPRLYVARALAEEQAIADSLLLDGSRRISVLLGGPGSGKTYTLAKDLIDLFAVAERPPRIALAAPTGKAAARMTQALEDRCAKAKASEAVLQAVRAAPATTVHRLLGYAPDRTPQFAYGPDNPLDYDIVVVDEVSMLSCSLLHRLLAALAPTTAIRLVGDPDQLTSVESGSVLADIAAACRRAGSPLGARLTELTGQHRYASDSAIAALASAIRHGDAAAAVALLEGGADSVEWIEPNDTARMQATESLVTEHARRIRDLVQSDSGTADDRAVRALGEQARLQVLCGTRGGRHGVANWNRRIERRLGLAAGEVWYAGRPVMITRNNYDLALYNGDVGLVTPADERQAEGSRMDAVFRLGDETIRVPVARLEDVLTVHALTIHKSQGSEYEHAIVVLPEEGNRILTRELLYTAVTRAARHLRVIGSRTAIVEAIGRPIRRATGLEMRLCGG